MVQVTTEWRKDVNIQEIIKKFCSYEFFRVKYDNKLMKLFEYFPFYLFQFHFLHIPGNTLPTTVF